MRVEVVSEGKVEEGAPGEREAGECGIVNSCEGLPRFFFPFSLFCYSFFSFFF